MVRGERERKSERASLTVVNHSNSVCAADPSEEAVEKLIQHFRSVIDKSSMDLGSLFSSKTDTRSGPCDLLHDSSRTTSSDG